MKLTSNDMNMIRSCLQACTGCPSMDCSNCPMRVDPYQLLQLADEYMDLMLLMHKLVEDYKA